MTKSWYQTIIKKSLQSNESHLYEVDIRGIFHWEALDPGDFVLLTSPTPWGKFSTLLNPLYNPPGWPGVLPLGQADDMCITRPCFLVIQTNPLIKNLPIMAAPLPQRDSARRWPL